jgi:hypothetical protein
MRPLRPATLAAALILGAFASPLAGATPLGPPGAVRLGLDQLRKIENVACYGHGWRGYGIYPGWYPACYQAVPVYPLPGYVVPAPVTPPAPGRCWVATGPDARSGYWRAC